MSDARILLFDLETSPFEAYTWGLWEQNVGLDQIKTEWSILSYCAKWFGEKQVLYDDCGGRGAKRVRDDRHLLRALWGLLDSADIVVAQNGKRFDVPRLNARLLMAGYGPYSPIRVVDTLQVAKSQFGFSSNKLAWTSKYLTDTPKSEHKKFPGFELWTECLKDNPSAWAEMKKYNIRDVVALEKLYVRLRPWITNHPNVGTYAARPDASDWACPACGSRRTQRRGVAVLQAGKYPRYHCQNCGHWSRGRKQVKHGT